MTKIFLVFLLVLFPLTKVHADDVYKEAYLSCDPEKNTAMVRFEAGWMGKPRQLKFSKTYSKYEYLNNSDLVKECVFKDGRKITLSYEVGQAFAYGQGGGDPPAYFNFKVGDKYAYYHKGFYSTFGDKFSDPLVIFLSGHTLVSCKGPSGFSDEANYAEQHINESDCTDESQRLISGVEMFPAELRALKEKEAQNEYNEISKNPELCEFIKTEKIHNLAENQKYDFGSRKKTPLGFVLESTLDINNDKKIDSVLQFASTDHYMDGVYLVAGDSKSIASILKCTSEQICPSGFPVPSEGSASVDEFVQIISQYWPKAYAVSGENVSGLGYRARYTNLYPVSFAGKTYVYFEPLNDTSFPRAAVGQVLADKKVDLICTYKRLPNGR